MAGSNVDFAQTVNAGPLVQVRLFLFPPDSEPAIPPGLLVRHFVADGWFHALAVGTAAELQPLAQQAALLKGQVRDMPAWLHTDMARNEAYVAAQARPCWPARRRRCARNSRRWTSATTCARRWATPRACNGCWRTCGRWKRATCSAGSPAGPANSPGIGWPARSTDRARARSCTIRRRRRAPRRRCCWPTRGGRGRSRCSAARWACRRATRPTRARCWRSRCR